MFKQKLFSLLIVMLLTALTIIGCRKGESSENVDVTADVVVNSPRWVTADAGLRMRDSAGSAGNKIGLIPNGEQVTLLLEEGAEETIAGASGRWSKVRWQEQEGWVFGGFLSTEQPVVEEESVDVVESSGKKILIDGKEFDESVLYGLYLIEFETINYQVIELLSDNKQVSHRLISDYERQISHDIYAGFPDEYIHMLKKSSQTDNILREVSTGEWSYDNDRGVLNILYFSDYGSISEYKVEVAVDIEDSSNKYTLINIEHKVLKNYIDGRSRIIKIER